MAKVRKAGAPSLRIREFLALVHDGVADRLGADLGGMQSRQRFGYLQYYRGDPGIHYEIWVQRRTSRLELGLHFETADRERNYAAAEALSMRQPDVVAAIGPDYELEEWTAQWTRLHRSFRASTLTRELADEAATRVCDLMRGMEPLLNELGLRR